MKPNPDAARAAFPTVADVRLALSGLQECRCALAAVAEKLTGYQGPRAIEAYMLAGRAIVHDVRLKQAIDVELDLFNDLQDSTLSRWEVARRHAPRVHEAIAIEAEAAAIVRDLTAWRSEVSRSGSRIKAINSIT